MHRRSVTFAAFSAIAIAVIAACADSDDGPPIIVEDGGSPEAAPPDGDTDVDLSDAGDGGIRTCSDQSFCHVVVPPNETLRDVWGDGTTVWAVSEEGDVLRWDGQKWSVHTRKLGALYTIWGSGPTDIWIGGARGLYHGTGASSQALVFEPVDAPGDPEIPILSIWGTGPDDVFAAGGHVGFDWMPHGRVLRRRGAGDGGSGWELEPISAEPFVFKRVWGSAAAGTWIAGDDGGDNSQMSAVFVRAPAADDLAPVTIDPDLPDESIEDGIPVGISGGGLMADGRVLVVGKTRNTQAYWYGTGTAGGTLTWSFEGRKPSDDRVLRAVWSISGKDTWVAGDYGALRSRGASGTWMTAAIMVSDIPVIEPLYGMWGTAADDFWVVGRNTAIHRMPRKEP